MLFSFREEFLPEFESITSRIPSLKYSRFRLLPMNGHQAYEVITKTWKNSINAAEADKIVRFFFGRRWQAGTIRINDDRAIAPQPGLLAY